jgi:2-polyprenyl-3-methyl-5-hydroxy-6-metoxy-1,4-benzoquinol methylase
LKLTSPAKVDQSLQAVRQLWDDAADSFDKEPDHGLHPPPVLAAWTRLLKSWLPANPADILDVGCGTGSLSVVMAGLGHRVTGIDLSPAMVAQARAKAKAQGYSIAFDVMNAADPQFPPPSFDGLVARHLLWALPEPSKVLQRWVELVRPNGRLILIEGFWNTGAGLHAVELLAALPSSAKVVSVENLSDQPDYWGKQVTDERYAVIVEHIP